MNAEECEVTRTPWVPALTMVLIPLLLGSGFGEEVSNPFPAGNNSGRAPKLMDRCTNPTREPNDSICSGDVTYDPNVSDPFFEKEEWSHTCSIPRLPDGRAFQDEKLPVKHTAKCVSSYQFQHTIDSCRATLLGDGTIKFSICYTCSPIMEYLWIDVYRGRFWNIYRTRHEYPGGYISLTWPTKHQELTLNHKVYRKGDTIKGKFAFESTMETTDQALVKYFERSQTTIKIYGVFETILE